jgi:hypothetical protein
MSRSLLRRLSLGMAAVVLSSTLARVQAEGDLDTIRSDVRTPPQSAPATSQPSSTEERTPTEDGRDHSQAAEELRGNLFLGALAVGAAAVTLPAWLPRVAMGDNSEVARFPRFPYDNTDGYLMSDAWMSGFTSQKILDEALGKTPADGTQADPTKLPDGSLISLSIDPSTRRWAGQFRADYADEFSDLSSIGGQLILETSSRFGIDTSAQYLYERLRGNSSDHLTLGDCNLVYRFAQCARAQMRLGIGANWLTDASRTDLGFNFTYGGDFFPRNPWVLSSDIDWGTLGRAGLFRFRATAGAIFNRFESYVGYEYLDIGTTQANFLIGGMRVWF